MLYLVRMYCCTSIDFAKRHFIITPIYTSVHKCNRRTFDSKLRIYEVGKLEGGLSVGSSVKAASTTNSLRKQPLLKTSRREDTPPILNVETHLSYVKPFENRYSKPPMCQNVS